jgi:hypothetical protein
MIFVDLLNIHFIRKSLFYYHVRFILISLIFSITLVLLIPTFVHAQVNPYEIIDVNVNKLFVEKHEIISVEGKITRINPDFNKVILILETKEGHRTDYTTTPVNDDGSFEHRWQTGSIYSGTWGESGVFVIKMNYASKDIWKEIEFVYCDKTYPHHPRYLEHCQEAYGEVEQVNSISESETKTKSNTLLQDGMELEYTGKDPIGSDLWVETDASYNSRIISSLAMVIIPIVIILIVIVVVIMGVRNRGRNKASEITLEQKEQLQQEKIRWTHKKQQDDEIQKLKEKVEELERDKGRK